MACLHFAPCSRGDSGFLSRSRQPQSDLDAILAVQLSDNRADQVLDALLFERHRFRDLLVCKALGDEASDLILAVR